MGELMVFTKCLHMQTHNFITHYKLKEKKEEIFMLVLKYLLINMNHSITGMKAFIIINFF